MQKIISIEEAVKRIDRNANVFIHGSAMTPIPILEEMAMQYQRYEKLNLFSITLGKDCAILHDPYRSHFYMNSLFVSPAVRENINTGFGDYIPVFLSEIPILFRDGIIPLDVAIIQVSPPDKHGFCTLGTSVDVAKQAVLSAKMTIAMINSKVPRSHGEGVFHVNSFDLLVKSNQSIIETPQPIKSNPIADKIGEYVSNLIEDGSTLQMGIGEIPDAVLSKLGNHKELGIHTEMFSDGLLPLFEKGVITNEHKKERPFKTVASFAMGTQKLYDFIDDNPEVSLLPADYVNDTSIIRSNPKTVAINSAIEIDLTGQVCSDSIGTYQYSGVGGQMDFIRGASLSEGGKPIIVIPSTTSSGISRISPILKPGAGVVTTRAHVQYVVTEYGVANLYGKNFRQRAKSLIDIAHPDHREMLEKSSFQRFGH